MNYELAKKLKDAGFPQKSAPFAVSTLVPIEQQERVYLPTLSELIEACGDCLSHIKKWHGNWWAVSHCGHDEHEPDGNNIEEAASTHEEAVANLWLTLHEKNED